MIVIITGGSRGIGKAIAERFAGEGVTLLLCAQNEDRLRKTAAGLSAGKAEVHYFAADLGNREEVKKFAAWCLAFGTPSILVNNAGTFVPGNVTDEADGNLEKMIRVNLMSAYYLTRALLPAMRNANTGHIFNMSSIAALKAYPAGGSYSISKFALNGFSQNLRYELLDTGIKVTTVFPGAVYTDSWEGFDNSTGRIMEAGDIAAMIYAAAGLSKQATVEEIIIRPQAGDL